MQRTALILTCALLFTAIRVEGQESTNMAADKAIISNFFTRVQLREGERFGDLIVRTALFFLNTPYAGATLEIGDEERLVINLRELDCTTLMETCIALSSAIRMNRPDFETYCRQLERIRYRVGALNGYVSRLHYMTDWIVDNGAKGVIEDITQKIGGESLKVHLSYMSSHPNAYKHLKDRPERTARIRQIEELINKRGNYHYIPKEKIPALRAQIQNGDLICFTTSIEGLDVSHVGIAYWQEGELTFIHASSTAKRVIVNPVSLFEYCINISSNTGIIVLRCRDLVSAYL